jgi:hypothetical protein
MNHVYILSSKLGSVDDVVDPSPQNKHKSTTKKELKVRRGEKTRNVV